MMAEGARPVVHAGRAAVALGSTLAALYPGLHVRAHGDTDDAWVIVTCWVLGAKSPNHPRSTFSIHGAPLVINFNLTRGTDANGAWDRLVGVVRERACALAFGAEHPTNYLGEFFDLGEVVDPAS